MILSKTEIEKLIEKGVLKVEPIFHDTIRENGLDLRIGDEYAVPKVSSNMINICEERDVEKFFNIYKSNSEIVIPPRGFVLLTTLEYIKLPLNIAGLCNLRSTLARWGLSIPPTVVDCGFEGNLTIEVVNNSPVAIKLKPRIRFLHLVLVKTEGEAKYSGTYLGQKGVRLPKSLRGECT